MAFNQQRVKSYASGALTAFATGGLTAYKGSQIALNTVTNGTVVSSAGLVIALAGPQFNIEWDSLVATVETNLTTSTLTVSSAWQGSWDNVTWQTFLTAGFPTGDQHATSQFTQVAAAGTGGLVTTLYTHPFYGYNPAFDYIRYAVKVGVATGAAGDNVTVSYSWRKRSFLA